MRPIVCAQRADERVLRVQLELVVTEAQRQAQQVDPEFLRRHHRLLRRAAAGPDEGEVLLCVQVLQPRVDDVGGNVAEVQLEAHRGPGRRVTQPEGLLPAGGIRTVQVVRIHAHAAAAGAEDERVRERPGALRQRPRAPPRSPRRGGAAEDAGVRPVAGRPQVGLLQEGPHGDPERRGRHEERRGSRRIQSVQQLVAQADEPLEAQGAADLSEVVDLRPQQHALGRAALRRPLDDLVVEVAR
mmetsp:Transcript_81755/g.176717  ORF Transcript_81755/g.176717 Transcript_81755/m.176717 type:complete len:242 (+) Transcript_81755:898-1623(+)